MTQQSNPPLLTVEHLSKSFPIRRGLLRRTAGFIRAVDDVSFEIQEGQTLGLVGESGCGKSTVGRLILRLIEPTQGKISFDLGQGPFDLLALKGEPLRLFRRNMQIVLQDPYSSLSPRMTVFEVIAEPLRAQRFGDKKAIEMRVRTCMDQMGLHEGMLCRYPHAFSGGQRQRIAIARALTLQPKLIVCDEPVSALDVSVQAQMINLLKDLQDSLGLTYLFIAHDLSVVENISHRIAVMYAGRIVEMGPGDEVFSAPQHPYTEALKLAAPQPNPASRGQRISPKGEVADLANLPPGCAFHPRCPYAEPRCETERPMLTETAPGRSKACHWNPSLYKPCQNDGVYSPLEGPGPVE